MEKKLLTVERQRELIIINRVLAVLVVLLAFGGGYLLSEREEWLKKETEPVKAQTVAVAASPGPYPVKGFTGSPLTSLLSGARYEFTIGDTQITKETTEKIIWAAQGKITNWGERTVPSYKSAFPLTLIVFVRNVAGMEPGFYTFDSETQSLQPLPHDAAMTFPETQPSLLSAPLIIGAAAPLTLQYDHMTWNEAGGVAQNTLLAAHEDGLVTYIVPASSLPAATINQFSIHNNLLFWLMPIGFNKER